MKTKLLVAILLSSLLASVFFTATSIRPAAANPDAIYTNPNPITKIPSDIDSFFDVYVDVQINDLFAFDIKITWDNALITFDSLNKGNLSIIWPQGFYEPLGETGPVYQTGPGYFRYVAVATGQPGYSGTHTLFGLHFKIVKACNFVLSTSIHFDTVKLSDSNANEIVATKTDGSYSMSATTPDLEFEFIDPTPSKPIEYCKTFQIKVYVTDICAQLEDYNLVIAYDSSLLKLTLVNWTGGVLGDESDGASYIESPAGTINVVDTGGIIYTGTKGLLFTLSFHVEFTDADPTHIWRTDNLGPLHAFIKFNDATLSFVEGSITKTGINMPSDLDIVVNLIRGDVDCNGQVDVFDLRTIAYFYDQTPPTQPQYDLKADGTIDIYDLVLIATNFGYNVPP
jgi:hypothetical protein